MTAKLNVHIFSFQIYKCPFGYDFSILNMMLFEIYFNVTKNSSIIAC